MFEVEQQVIDRFAEFRIGVAMKADLRELLPNEQRVLKSVTQGYREQHKKLLKRVGKGEKTEDRLAVIAESRINRLRDDVMQRGLVATTQAMSGVMSFSYEKVGFKQSAEELQFLVGYDYLFGNLVPLLVVEQLQRGSVNLEDILARLKVRDRVTLANSSIISNNMEDASPLKIITNGDNLAQITTEIEKIYGFGRWMPIEYVTAFYPEVITMGSSHAVQLWKESGKK